MSPSPSAKESSDNLLDTAKYSGIGAALTAVTNWFVQQVGAESLTGEAMAGLTIIYGTGLQWMVLRRKATATRKRAKRKSETDAPKPDEQPEKQEGSEG